jgi:CheY-like chemotaxis protein
MIRSLVDRLVQRLLALLSSRADTLEEALLLLVEPEVLARARSQESDPRKLLSAVAALTGVRESVLIQESASLLGLAYLPRVLPTDIRCLPSGSSLEDFRRSGALPIIGDGTLTGIVCTDPALVANDLRVGSTPDLYLGSWVAISRALDQSERDYVAAREAELAAEAQRSRELAERTPALIVAECRRHGATACIIDLRPETVGYSFVLPDGRRGRGSIARPLRQAIAGTFERILTSTTNELVVEGSPTSIALERHDVPDMYRISWSADPTRSVEQPAEHREELPIPVERPVEAPVPARRWNLLTIDDNRMFAAVIGRYLDRHGFDVTHAHDGGAALELLRSMPALPEGIVCDLHMPGTDGLQFLKALREDPRLGLLPVLMLTSDDDIEVELKLLEAGADMFIAKSEDPRKLCAHIRKLVERAPNKVAA